MWRRHSQLHIAKHPLKGGFLTPLIEAHTIDIYFMIALLLDNRYIYVDYGPFKPVQNQHILEAILRLLKEAPKGNSPTMTLQIKHHKGRRDCHPISTTLCHHLLGLVIFLIINLFHHRCIPIK